MSNAAKPLAGKVAFITGLARGQGRAHAVGMAAAGADIIGVDICRQIESCGYPLATPDDLKETVRLVESEDQQIAAFEADVRDRDQIASALSEGIARFGQLDIVVANAGIGPIFGEAAYTMRAWQDALDVLLTGAYNTADLAADYLVNQGTGGAIVLTGSAVGLRSMPLPRAAMSHGFVGYIAAKHAIVGLTRHFASVLAPYNIRVNSIHPTSVNTPMISNEGMREFASKFPEMSTALQNALPVQALEPSDIANASVWLASDAAKYVTGVMLPVDAGCLFM
jgi:SDR family mycofactocin-dependent oxidoreductase